MKAALPTSPMSAANASAAPPKVTPAGSAQPLPSSGRKNRGPGAGRPAKENSQIKLLLVDDHPVVRKGIGSCLARHERLVIVGEAADGLEAVTKARALLPDVVLLDIDMPKMSGLAVTELLHKELPRIKVLILSMYQRSEYLLRIIQSGARGYVLKDISSEDLLKAIETVHAGGTFFSPELAHLALDQFVQGIGEAADLAELTTREREVLVLVAEGLSNKEIAKSFGVGVRTVETHRERIMRKLAIHSVAGLTRFAIAKGMVTLRAELPH